MSRDTFVSSAAPLARDAHESIFAALSQMARNLEWLDPADPDPKVFDRVLAHLRELRAELQRHFDAEDSSRLLPRLLSLLPDAGREVGELEAQHRTTLRLLDEAAARAIRPSPLHVERLRGDLEAVLAVLFEHEATEEQLMSRAFEPS